MKNILSPVKSCSILLCALLLLAAGCKKDHEKEPQKEQETFVSNVARPTWTAPDHYDMTSSMTAVIKVDLAAQYPNKAADFVLENNDLLAAFSGETCLGMVSPKEDLFFLYIAGAEGAVTLRYYSAQYKNLFVATDAFPFANDAHLGTIADPIVPSFVVAK